MKEPNLQITTLLSLLLHVTFLFVALLIMKQSNHFVIPSAYIVSLVGPESGKGTASVPEASEKESPAPIAETKKTIPSHENAEQYAQNRIAAIEATRKAKRIVNLRNMIFIRGSGTSESKEDISETSQPAGNTVEETLLKNYFDKIGGEIRQQWAFPEAWDKNLVAIVSVTIMQDGTIKKIRIEQGSGNLLFDGSVLKAIIKASPVSPPPYEMEKELRFRP